MLATGPLSMCQPSSATVTLWQLERVLIQLSDFTKHRQITFNHTLTTNDNYLVIVLSKRVVLYQPMCSEDVIIPMPLWVWFAFLCLAWPSLDLFPVGSVPWEPLYPLSFILIEYSLTLQKKRHLHNQILLHIQQLESTLIETLMRPCFPSIPTGYNNICAPPIVTNEHNTQRT